jgi:hypothetical protein
MAPCGQGECEMTYENQGPVMEQHQTTFNVGDTQDLKTSREPKASQIDLDIPAVSQIALLLQSVESELIPCLFVNHRMDVPSTSACM